MNVVADAVITALSLVRLMNSELFDRLIASLDARAQEETRMMRTQQRSLSIAFAASTTGSVRFVVPHCLESAVLTIVLWMPVHRSYLHHPASRNIMTRMNCLPRHPPVMTCHPLRPSRHRWSLRIVCVPIDPVCSSRLAWLRIYASSSPDSPMLWYVRQSTARSS